MIFSLTFIFPILLKDETTRSVHHYQKCGLLLEQNLVQTFWTFITSLLCKFSVFASQKILISKIWIKLYNFFPSKPTVFLTFRSLSKKVLSGLEKAFCSEFLKQEFTFCFKDTICSKNQITLFSSNSANIQLLYIWDIWRAIKAIRNSCLVV